MDKLAQLEGLAAFFDFVSNPGQYKALIEEAKAATAELEKARLVARKIADVDKFRIDTEAMLDKREASINAKSEAFDKKVKEEVEAILARQAKVEEHEKAIAKRVAEIVDLVKVKEDATKAVEELEDARKQLAEDKANYNKAVSEFADRVARLEKALG